MGSQEDGHAKLDAMTGAKHQASDGSLKVIIAVASITDLVTVDTTVDPFTFKPSNLANLAFNDPAVGMNDGQMPIFKANLSRLLPEISSDIDKIPENASMLIRKVAEYVNICLLAVS